MTKAPCKDCPNRQVGCHSTCEKYIVFRKERDELNELKNKAKNDEKSYYSGYNRSSMKRTQKSKLFW